MLFIPAEDLDMNTLHTMFALISDCENALLFFVAPPLFSGARTFPGFIRCWQH